MANTKGSWDLLTESGRGGKLRPVNGLTLLEILFAAAIICILAGIANIAYQYYILKAQNSAAIADVRVLESEIASYLSDWGSFPVDLSQVPSGN
ncbi:MAG TPA: prepilin-type N-terminal cleavage/methylation domain-containing protein [Nitrospirota bacterium]|nr:prepilin-type N-terminal cleavage/methylation domain-containing protein [Nitrospirota bacterium]